MNKTFLIIKREFLVRVKKKSFIIMTLLAPILMAGLIIAPVLLTDNDNQERLIAVFEDNSSYSNKLEDSENIFFNLIDQSEAEKFKKDEASIEEIFIKSVKSE